MKKINFLLFSLLLSISVNVRAEDVGSDFKLDKPGSILGGKTGLIWSAISGSTIKAQIVGTAWLLAIAMIITVMATGIFSHHDNLMKSALKILVTLMGVGILIYWGTNAG
mgnify:FL=1